MSIQPLVFTGVSSFSNDFQTILTRAQQIAQVPVQQLQNKDSDVLTRKTLLGGLSAATASLGASLKALGTVASNHALAATSSDTTKVTAASTGATLATSYTIDSITSAATQASERSVNFYLDSAATPVSSTGSLDLVVGGVHNTFSLTNNTLVGLRDKINGLDAGVTASILTTSGGNYLSVSANGTGNKALQLIDDPTGAATALLTNANPGTNAVFKLNGIDITQSGNVVNSVIPGVTFTIKAASATAVQITLASDRSQLASALQDLVSNFNGLRAQVNGQIGAAGGMLTGSAVIAQLANTLRQISSYGTSTGSVRGLADLGVTFNNSGEVAFNQDTFNALSSSAVIDGFNYLGSATTGLGGFSSALDQVSNSATGAIHVEQAGLDRTDHYLQTQIATLNERITISQNYLAARLHAADALLAMLTSQQKQLTASLQGLSLTLYGRSTG